MANAFPALGERLLNAARKLVGARSPASAAVVAAKKVHRRSGVRPLKKPAYGRGVARASAGEAHVVQTAVLDGECYALGAHACGVV